MMVKYLGADIFSRIFIEFPFFKIDIKSLVIVSKKSVLNMERKLFL